MPLIQEFHPFFMIFYRVKPLANYISCTNSCLINNWMELIVNCPQNSDFIPMKKILTKNILKIKIKHLRILPFNYSFTKKRNKINIPIGMIKHSKKLINYLVKSKLLLLM